MLLNSHILSIDDSPQNRHDLAVILGFLGEDAIISDSQSWLADAGAQVESAGAVKCVILGRCEPEHGCWDSSISGTKTCR